MAHCPNCSAPLQINATECAKCSAIFVIGATWRPVPDSLEEEQHLANPVDGNPPSLGGSTVDFVWLAFKLCFTGFLVLVTLVIAATDFKDIGSPSVWGLLGFLLFFSAAPWIDYKKPSRALALAGIVVAIVLSSGAWRIAFNTTFPLDCTNRIRWRVCELENQLYSIGGAYAAAGLSVFFALLFLYGAYIAFRYRRAA